MKKKLKLFIIITFLSLCFIILYKGLNSSNVYTPKINQKQKLPIFEAKDFYTNKSVSSEELLKKIFFML